MTASSDAPIATADGEPKKDATALHLEFVAMLFALAAAEVATESVEFAKRIRESKWQANDLAGLSHLVLSLTVIATSWVGWNASHYHGSKRSKELSVFSLDFIEMLLDVVLVIVYFLLVKNAEQPDTNGAVVPAFRCDAMYIAVILLLYFLWDCVSKCEKFAMEIKRIAISLACFLLAVAAIYCTRDTAETLWSTLAMNVSLLSLMLLFRAWKSYRYGWVCVTTIGMIVSLTATIWLGS